MALEGDQGKVIELKGFCTDPSFPPSREASNVFY